MSFFLLQELKWELRLLYHESCFMEKRVHYDIGSRGWLDSLLWIQISINERSKS